MTTPTPEGADRSRPSPARLYDYYLDGKDHYPIDRETGNRLLKQIPELKTMARANRAWLRRVVRYLARQGIDQFLDLGSGLPTVDNTHELAQSINPDARVVYIDHDPLVVIHGKALLATDPGHTAVVAADLRDPWSILAHRETKRLLNFSRPVAALFVAVLHFLPDDARPYDLVRIYRDALPTRSFVAISHVDNEAAPHRAAQLEEVYAATSAPGQTRNRTEITRFFDGMELVEPGVTYVSDWRPDLGTDECTGPEVLYPPDKAWVLAGVGRL